MRTITGIALTVLVLSTLAGCVELDPQDADPPRLEIMWDERPVPQNRHLELDVHFRNSGDTAFEVETQEGCLQVDAWVQVAGTAILLDGPDRDCPGEAETIRIGPGEERDWGPYRLLPAEFQQGGDDLFQPGTSYPLIVDLSEGTPSWSVRNETVLEVAEPVPDVTLEVEPGPRLIRHGENATIQAVLTNPRDEPFSYTSSDGCNDIHLHAYEAGEDGDHLRLWPDMEPYFCTQAVTEFEIGPGETLEMTFHWDGSADGQGGAPFVPEADYLLVATLDGRHDLPSGQAAIAVRAPE